MGKKVVRNQRLMDPKEEEGMQLNFETLNTDVFKLGSLEWRWGVREKRGRLGE